MWGKYVRVAAQLLHGLAHFRLLGEPGEGEAESDIRLRAKDLHKLSSSLLSHLKVRHSVIGRLPDAGLLVANHLGFLDIMTLSALRPMVFVSKSDVARWHFRLSRTTSVRGVAALPIGACGLWQMASHGSAAAPSLA
ncbi:MAG: hypothetical protein EBS01_15240, partial [Verrucomicrobia bacterium]|nr:hypothetical protein [Verrucomicrobiota bacterium]